MVDAGGRLEQLLTAGMAPPPRYERNGIQVWEGRVWREDDRDLPSDAEPRDGVWFQGEWRPPTDDEWLALKERRHPWP